MSKLEDLQKEFGINPTSIPKMKNEGGGGYYIQEVGEHTGYIGRLKIQYLDLEGKKCDKDTPGAVAAYCMLGVVVAADPLGRVLDDKFEFDLKIPYGRLVFQQYISLKPEDQWKNVKLFDDLTFNDLEGLNIITGNRGEEDINLYNFKVFYGSPVKFDIIAGKKKDSRFVNGGFTMLDHAFSKEKYTKRKTSLDTIYGKIIEKLENDKKAKEDKSSDTAPADVESPDDFLNDFA